MKHYEEVKWWRYPVAILSFVAIYFVMPFILALVLQLSNFILPPAYQYYGAWLWLSAYTFSAVAGFKAVEAILLKSKYVFQAIWAALAAAYTLFTAILNWSLGVGDRGNLMGLFAFGVVSIVFVGISCKKNSKP